MPSEYEVCQGCWRELPDECICWEKDDEWDMCSVCDGLGTDKWDDDDLCWSCMGEGMVPKIV